MREQHVSETAELEECLAEARCRTAEVERRAEGEAQESMAAAAAAAERIAALEAELQRRQQLVADSGREGAARSRAGFGPGGLLMLQYDGCSSVKEGGRLVHVEAGGGVVPGAGVRAAAVPDGCGMPPRTCVEIGAPSPAEEV